MHEWEKPKQAFKIKILFLEGEAFCKFVLFGKISELLWGHCETLNAHLGIKGCSMLWFAERRRDNLCCFHIRKSYMGFWPIPKQKLNSAASSEGWLLSFETHCIIKNKQSRQRARYLRKKRWSQIGTLSDTNIHGTITAIKEWVRKSGEEQQLLRTGGCSDTSWINTDISDLTKPIGIGTHLS